MHEREFLALPLRFLSHDPFLAPSGSPIGNATIDDGRGWSARDAGTWMIVPRCDDRRSHSLRGSSVRPPSAGSHPSRFPERLRRTLLDRFPNQRERGRSPRVIYSIVLDKRRLIEIQPGSGKGDGKRSLDRYRESLIDHDSPAVTLHVNRCDSRAHVLARARARASHAIATDCARISWIFLSIDRRSSADAPVT